MEGEAHRTFITICPFERDASKPGRVLSTAQIGDVFMSRLEIEPGMTTGGYYHKETEIVFYVASGSVQMTFEQVCTKHSRSFTIEPLRQVIHVPSYNRISAKNVGKDTAALVFFSNEALRSDIDSFIHAPKEEGPEDEIDMFSFDSHATTNGHSVSSVKIGPMYISRIVIEPGTEIGNYYHSNADVMFYASVGTLECIFEDVNTKERTQIVLSYADKAIQMPAFVAMRLMNRGTESVNLVMFTRMKLVHATAVEYSLT